MEVLDRMHDAKKSYKFETIMQKYNKTAASRQLSIKADPYQLAQ